jgi:translation initiation factor 6
MFVLRCEFKSSSDIGIFIFLTNSYVILPVNTPKHFLSLLELSINNKAPIIQCTIAFSEMIGSFAVGNSKGLLLPSTVRNQEIQFLCDNLPDNVIVRRIDDKNSALGNSIACNDNIAIVNPEFDQTAREAISDALCVDTLPFSIGDKQLVGSHCVLSNRGGAISAEIKLE